MKIYLFKKIFISKCLYIKIIKHFYFKIKNKIQKINTLLNYFLIFLNSFLILLSLQVRLQPLFIPENIPLIFVTLLVLKLDKFKEIKEEQL